MTSEKKLNTLFAENISAIRATHNLLTYYAEHLLGEVTGATSGIYTVPNTDRSAIAAAVGQTADVTNILDIDKNGTIAFAGIPPVTSNLGAHQENIATAVNPLADLTRSQSWSLDALGNFQSLTNNDGPPQSRTHNLQNQVIAVGGANLSFDANGNMTVDEQGRTFIWDAWNRLVEVKQGSTTLVEYQYDGLKRRIVEDDGTSERHLYYSDQWQVLEERVDGDTKVQYVWSAVYVDAMILRDRDADENSSNGLEERIYVLHDANYNVTAIVDKDGEVIERYYYEAYGRAVYLDDAFALLPDGQSDHGWRHLHQGGRLDPATGNYHFRHRDLSPTLGRWISQDPIGFEAGDANLYRYVGNGPVGHLDPLGLQESIFPGGLGSEKPATINEELSGRKFLERIGKAVGAFIRQQPQVRQLEEDIKEQGEQLLNRAFPFWKAKEPKKPGALIDFPESDDPWHPPLKPRPVKEPLWKRLVPEFDGKGLEWKF